MKKFFYILCFLVSLYSWGSQRTETIQLNFSAGDFQFTQIDGKTHISSNVHDLLFEESELFPKIPKIGIDVLIGPNEQFDTLTYSFSNSIMWNNINIAACEVPIRTDSEGEGGSSNSSNFDGIYPATVEYQETATLDGYKMVRLIVNPFAFDGLQSTLALNQCINVSLCLNQPNPVHVPSNNPVHVGGAFLNDFVEDVAVNGDDMSSLYGDPVVAMSALDSINYYTYLLITNENLKSSFEPLAHWKTRKGVRAKVLTVEEICSQYNGNSIPLKIKAAIKDYQENHSTKYVLLGGDEHAVPAQPCYIQMDARSNGEYKTHKDTVQSDFFYACLKKMDWDSNGDGIAAQLDSTGYVGDSAINIEHQVVISRLPAENTDGAQAMVQRIINYEMDPIHGEWNDNILLTGVVIDTVYTLNGRQISDTEIVGQTIYDQLQSNGWNGDIVRFFDTYTDMPSGTNYKVNNVNMIKELNKGYTLVHEESHGSRKRWVLDHNSFYRSQARTVVNEKKGTVILTAACSTNAFDDGETCLSQAFLESTKSGVLAYYGSQRLGLRDQSATLNKKLLERLLSETNCLGKAAMNARLQFMKNSYYKHGAARWLGLATNLMGDPEMPVYLSRPLERTDVKFNFHNNILTVSTHNNDQFKVCVSSLNDYGEHYYLTGNSINGRASFLGATDNVYVSITSPGYIPFVQNIQKNTYIQNETISDNRLIVAENTYVGQNVTGTLSQGPVVVESGNLEIQSAGGVLLAPGTEIKKNASLEVKTNL